MPYATAKSTHERSATNRGYAPQHRRRQQEAGMVEERPLAPCVSSLGQSKNRGAGECEAYPDFCSPEGSHLAPRPGLSLPSWAPCLLCGRLRGPPTTLLLQRPYRLPLAGVITPPERSWQSPVSAQRDEGRNTSSYEIVAPRGNRRTYSTLRRAPYSNLPQSKFILPVSLTPAIAIQAATSTRTSACQEKGWRTNDATSCRPTACLLPVPSAIISACLASRAAT
jgi:hypothetical protein